MSETSDKTASAVRVVRLGPRDWRTFKAVRLEALRREPAAFSSTYAETRARPDESWRQWLENPRCLVLVALIGSRPIGVVGAYLGSEDGDETVAVVFGMYVSDKYRGRGLGRLLLSTLIALVSNRHAIRTIRLWVGKTQESARRLYESLGFHEVDQETHLRLRDSSSDDDSELIMERPIQP